MTESPGQSANDKESEQWLAALSGHPDQAAPPHVNKEAGVVRDVLQAELDSLKVAETDETEYQRLLFRLRKEKLLNRNIAPSEPATRWRRTRFWGIAASITLAVGLTTIMFTSREVTDEGVYRGGATLIVDDPSTVAAGLTDGLGKVSTEITAYTHCDGTVDLTAKATSEALDYLANDPRRIFPLVANDSIALRITPVQPLVCTTTGTARDWVHEFNLRLHRLLSAKKPPMDRISPTVNSTP